MKIGIYVGSFNPPHIIHKNIILDLLNNKIVDKIIIIPSNNNYKKKELIDIKYRINMLKILINKNPKIKITKIYNKYNYTYQFLDYYNSKNNQIYLILGSDNYNKINTWKNYKYIINNYKIIIIPRIKNISSTKIRNNIKNNKNIEKYTKLDIIKYIKENDLYKEV